MVDQLSVLTFIRECNAENIVVQLLVSFCSSYLASSHLGLFFSFFMFSYVLLACLQRWIWKHLCKQNTFFIIWSFTGMDMNEYTINLSSPYLPLSSITTPPICSLQVLFSLNVFYSWLVGFFCPVFQWCCFTREGSSCVAIRCFSQVLISYSL